ncbi:hypothetical protein GCM10027047_34380 [Rhodococcus aerolatus]
MSTTDTRLPDRDPAAGEAGVATSGTGPGPVRRAATVVGALSLLLLVVAAAGFYLTGGRWLSVSTPSMGEAAPVGTLVLTRPTTLAELRVGDVISYHPEPEPGVTYTHRVVERTAEGVRTQGDINGAVDPWTVHDADLVGKVTARLWGVGWLTRALPFWLLGGVALWALTRWLAPGWLRGPARLLGAALLVLGAAAMLRPFAAAVQLTTTSDDGVTNVSMVSTGMLPIRLAVSNADATPLDLRAGQTGVLSITGQPPEGRADIGLGLHMPVGWWVVVVLIWLSPTLWVLLGGLRPVPPGPTPADLPPDADARTDPDDADLVSDLLDGPGGELR